MTSLTFGSTSTPDQLAAHSLLCELRTRIAVQPLPYQYGIETRALESLWEIFGLARKSMKDYPGCQKFSQITTNMLNVDLRPITAKWHRAHKAGLLDSKDGANDFRSDLAILRRKLLAFSQDLQLMAYGTQHDDEVTPDVISTEEISRCFEPISFGIEAPTKSGIKNGEEINTAEATEIAARRTAYQIETPKGTDAIGLSLSGGGIRSATFCLGVVQVLAERGLMKDVDYLSSVSGGGYIGSFITSTIGSGKDFSEVGKPYGPDTESVRHVRQNAKYLSAVDLKQRWLMATEMIAGLMLNWTAPLSILALLAWCGNYVMQRVSQDAWLTISGGAGCITAAFILLYGVALRTGIFVRAAGWVLACGGGATLLALMSFALEHGYHIFSFALATHWSVSGFMAALVIGVPAIVLFLPVFGRPSTKKFILKLVLFGAGCIAPLLAISIYYIFRSVGSQPLGSNSWWLLKYVEGDTALLTIAAVSGGFALFVLNVNLTGIHKIYRDQLARTFVRNASMEERLISKLNSSNKAPYHLINTTVNLPSSSNRALRDRRGDFFLFSKHWCGAPAIGYHATSEWEQADTQLDLATAMAVSGAAASSHMGRSTLPTLSALLTLLNVRLGYWIAHPRHKRLGAPGFLCLLREMTGFGMSESKAWLNLSDGGHIENMGIYELLRRRCKFIVCVDGEADPQSTFEGQLTLVRHAQIDFGVRLEPRLDDIRLDPKSRFSRTHFHLFRIHYPSAEPGQPEAIGLMLYLKLSLTGDETELLKRYRALHPDFPHQSTIDQFYDEEQFEAYRQLGVHVAEGAFSPALLTEDANPKSIPGWFKQMARNMLEPSNT